MSNEELEELVNLLDQYITEYVDDDNSYLEFSSVKSEIEDQIY